MARKCSEPNCENPVFGKSKCRFHYPKSLIKAKKKGIKRISEKGKIKKEAKTIRTKEIHLAMYNWWLKQVNKCMACGCNLPSEFHTWMVDHLIEKSGRPDLALEEWNFFLVCFDDHSRKTNGFPSLKHAQAIEQAKEYDKFLKDTDG